MRVGQGFDVHRWAEGRALRLGGVDIPYHLGLLGHSDADVLLHALMDALLGAAGMGDIGRHFPDSDARYKGIDSCDLLRQVVANLIGEAWQVVNVDATVICQQPRLAAHIPAMERTISSILKVSDSMINIKATTTEGLGFTGREEGVAAQAIVLLTRLRA
ncbi:MAG: 2-C-methyl-D-erythritol 2,4-cyclodiphosphate synthase [Magnetococcales bacterium]|nr:2-C-methyl-D-erythritol 2,4-cyclodiphosphate synthase [Magnetococcales bacterium]